MKNECHIYFSTNFCQHKIVHNNSKDILMLNIYCMSSQPMGNSHPGGRLGL